MGEPTDRDDLLAAIDAAWQRLDDELHGATNDMFRAAAGDGWSAKDHLAHLAAWNRYLAAVLAGQPDAIATFGVDRDLFAEPTEDRANAALRRAWTARSLDDVWDSLEASHREIRDRVAALDPAELGRPFRQLQPDDPQADDDPLAAWVVATVPEHYDEHCLGIRAALAAGTADATVVDEVARIDAAFAELEAVMAALPPDATERRDGDGWSLADHLTHLAAWDRGVIALLRGEPRHAAIGLTEEEWRSGDEALMNVRIAEANRGVPLDEAWTRLQATVRELRATLAGLSDADLQRPYGEFQPNDSPFNPLPVRRWVRSAGEVHLRGHLPAIRALAAGG